MANVSPTKVLRLARNIAYPNQIWWLIASFLALLSLLHLTNILILLIQRKKILALNRKQTRDKNDPEKVHHSSSSSKLKTGILRRLEAAIRETTSILLYRYTVPVGSTLRINGAETFVVVAYTIMVLIWTFINCYNSDTGLKFDPLFYANRAGDIAISHMPLLVLLAGKNNLISLITGISFEKLHIFHRAVARVSLILLLVHTGGRLHLGLEPDEASTAWLRIGYAAVAVWIVSVIVLIRPLRARFYNIVFIIHLVMSLVALIATYYHVKGINGNTNYLVPAIFFWGFDRVIRVIRIIWNSRGSSTTPNKAEIISPDLIKLTIHQKMTWKAGQSAYITLSKVSILPFEAHPFTIVTLPAEEENKTAINELVFLIRIRNGFTRRLYRAITEAQGRNEEFQFRAFIDGPYGSSPDLSSFSDIVIIAGGSGLSFGLPALRETVRAVRDGRSVCTSVLLVWVTSTPDINTLTYILDSFQNILENAPAFLEIKIQLYNTTQTVSAVPSLPSLTAGTPKDEKDSSEIEKEANPLTATSSSPSSEVEKNSTPVEKGIIAMLSGRPDIKHLLEEKLSLVQTNLSVNVAGPPSMVEDVRKALRFNVITPEAKLKGQPGVYLYTKPYEIA